MTDYFIIKYSTDYGANWTEITNWSELEFIILEGAISFAKFQIQNERGANTSTYEGLEKDWIQIIKYVDGTDDILKFQGYIRRITPTNPLTVYCEDNFGKMKWYKVTDEAGTTIEDEGLIEDSNGTSVDLNDDDQADTLALANDQYNDKDITYYIEVSDNTLDTDSETLENPIGGYLGFGSTDDTTNQANDYTDVTLSSNATYWEERASCQGPATHRRMLIQIDLGQHAIAKTNTLTKMEISLAAFVDSVGFSEFSTGVPTSLHLCMHNGDTASDLLDNIIRTWSIRGGVGGATVADQEVFLETTEIELDESGKSLIYFNQGAVNWEDGYIGFVVESLNYDQNYIDIDWDSLSIKLYYESVTFDVINAAITDTVTTKTITTATNFQTAGVVEGDKWIIAKDAKHFFNNCFVGLTPIPPGLNYRINNDSEIGRCITKRFNYPEGLELWIELCNSLDFKWYCDYSDNTARLTAMLESDYPDGGTITGFKHNPTPESKSTTYGYVVLIYKDGAVVVPTGISDPECYYENRKDILTRATALYEGGLIATRIATAHRNHQLTWDGWKDIRVGTDYSFTIYTDTYEDQPCSQVQYYQQNKKSTMKVTGFFGGAHTPDEQYVAKTIGDIKKKQNREDTISLTAGYSPVKRHSQLLGLNGHTDQYHISSTQYGYLDATSSIQDQLDAKLATANKYTDAEAVAAIEADDSIYTKTEIDAYFKIGSGNADYIACSLGVEENVGKLQGNSAAIENVDATDVGIIFDLTGISFSLGSLKLYVCGYLINIKASGAADYVTRIRGRKINGTSETDFCDVDHDTVNGTGAGTFTSDFAAVDMSSMDKISVKLYTTVGTGGNLQIGGFKLKCYYDT